MPDPSVAMLWIQGSALSEPIEQQDTLAGATAADRAWAAAQQHPDWSRLPEIMQVEGLVAHALTTLAVAVHGGPPAAVEAACEYLVAAAIVRPDHYGLRAMQAATTKGLSPSGLLALWRSINDTHPRVRPDANGDFSTRLERL